MNENRTTSILQRVPVILAVTAASYGLSLQPRQVHGTDTQKTTSSQKASARAKAFH